ncbi:MAG: hypothetical protein ACOZNI_27365 [Myxococcota bacterium]
MSPLDVMVVWPALVTPAMDLSYGEETARPFGAGVVVDRALVTLPRATVLGQVGARVWGASLDVDGTRFAATVTDVELEIGERWGPGWSKRGGGEPSFFWELGFGPHLVVFDGAIWDPHLNPALGLHTAIGGVIGTGRVRALVQLRSSATLRIDSYYGSVTMPEDAIRWDYHPGRIGLELLGGIELR